MEFVYVLEKCLGYHRGEQAYAMGWLKLGPNVHWWIWRREGVVETTYRTHC
jgi:hypothetical protein